jgi:integrase/recombinase XerC
MGKTAAESPTWAAAVDRFVLDLAERERSDHTRANYKEDLVAFAGWYEAKYHDPPTLALLAPSELREWRAHLREERRLEPATVNRKLAALQSLLRWAESEGIAPEIAVPKSLRQVKPPPRWLDRKQQRALVRAVEKSGRAQESSRARDVGLVKLLLHTGLRVEEAVDLRWADVKVRERSGSLVVRKGKGRKQRTVPLNSEARAALIELKSAGPKGAPEVLHGQRGALTVRGVQAILKLYEAPAKIEELSPHVLRHTFGKNLADSGTPIQTIADLMGHESLETTRRYVQPGHEDLAAAVEKLAGGDDH